jgi:hypothetical protein
MTDERSKVEVRVSKSGPSGRPLVEVIVDDKITPSRLAEVVNGVVTSEVVYARAGIVYHPECKSGLDVYVSGKFQDVFTVNV